MPFRQFLPALLFAAALHAEVRVAQLLTDHMVVQQNMPVHVWGSASPGESVDVAFRTDTRNTVTDNAGRWSVWFPPVPEPGGPHEINIRSGAKTIRLRDVLVGEVWIAAGQSNMEWPVAWAANPDTEKQAANYPQIRLVRTMHRVRDYPQDDFVGTAWEPATPHSVEKFSAVGYHFARMIHQHRKVPIGIIQSAWGGTPAEAWTSLRGLSSSASLMPVFEEWGRVADAHDTALRRHRYRLDDWVRKGSKGDRPELRTGPGGPWTPTGLFNGMLAPITKLPIQGVIWYQGESNTSPERAPVYEHLFPAMIRDWRRAWSQGDFPFLFVQLANFNAAPDSMWPEVRDAQRQALGVTNTAMAVTIDAGTPDDIHPRNKRIVADRLFRAARALVYNEPIVPAGPLFRQATIEGAQLRLRFDNAGGLVLRSSAGFELAGENGKWFTATPRLEGATVLVSAPEVPEPRYVRYAWADNPPSTLYNAEGLPASPFRTRR
ncbi:MAG: sialate O-acetylesterase [Bryobacteraceae bacterium]|nr:sialate O-acetylesterase [Bryobacteraceae bacterium]